MAKSLLVLAGGPLQLPAITTAKRMGLRVIVLDSNPYAPGMRLGDISEVIDITDPDACLAVAGRERIDGAVHICSEVSMATLGTINERLGLAGIDVATAIRSTNKGMMRRAFEGEGAPSPRSISAATEAEALEAARAIGGPLIVKPSRNSGSRGVAKVDIPDNRRVVQAFQRAIEVSRDQGVVVEEYVDGPEFSVELLVWNRVPRVLAVTDKCTTGSPYFVETGHSQPSLFPEMKLQQVEQAAIAGVNALGIDWAAAHAEIKLSAQGPRIIEIGARLGGDFITTELVPLSTGIDMVEAVIRLALGEIPDLTQKTPLGGAAIRYMIPPPGRVTAIEGITKAKAIPGVKIVEIDVHIGDEVGECTSSLSRVGHVIAQASSADEAIAIAERARNTIRIETQ